MGVCSTDLEEGFVVIWDLGGGIGVHCEIIINDFIFGKIYALKR